MTRQLVKTPEVLVEFTFDDATGRLSGFHIANTGDRPVRIRMTADGFGTWERTIPATTDIMHRLTVQLPQHTSAHGTTYMLPGLFTFEVV